MGELSWQRLCVSGNWICSNFDDPANEISRYILTSPRSLLVSYKEVLPNLTPVIRYILGILIA